MTMTMVFAFMPLFAFAQSDESAAPAVQAVAMEETGGEVVSEDPEQGDPGQSEGEEGTDEGDPEEGDEIVTQPVEKPEPAKSHAKAAEKTAVATAPTHPAYELTVVGEEQTPLSNSLLDSDCCLLHLLLIFLAAVAMIIYIVDMRKQQARIFELEDELEGFFDE